MSGHYLLTSASMGFLSLPKLWALFFLLAHLLNIHCLEYANHTLQSADIVSMENISPADTSLETQIPLSRSKRQVYRGQNYHYQRGYELSRLNFENRHPDRPKAFFVREFHEGRDVPKPLLVLTQPHLVADPVPSGIESSIPSTTASTLIETDISAPPKASAGGDSMKTMSDDYRQRLYATKAALKAALQAGDKDVSILEYIKAKQEAEKAKAKAKEAASAGSGGRPGEDQIEQNKEGKDDGNQAKEIFDAINKGVLFDEQIKEDLDKIVPYDPRLRPYLGGAGGGGGVSGSVSPTRKPTTGGGGSSGGPTFSRVPGVSGVGGGGGLPGSQLYPSVGTGDYVNKLRRLYPNLFPEFDRTAAGGTRGSGRPSGAGASGTDGGASGGAAVRPGAGSGASGGGPGSGAGSFGAGGGGLWPGSRPRPGSAAGLNGTIIVPPGGSGFRSPYPSRFPGTRLSGLTLWPNVRNSTYPGIPGYSKYDFPAYSTVPYTGFRCDLQPYKYGYYADVAAGCQVFHICQKDGRQDSFLCPNGTIFHQKVMTCDWWYHVNCPSSPGFYHLNGRIGVLPFLPATLARFD